MKTIWSVVVNRKDKPGQRFWTEWLLAAVSVGGTPAQAGDIVLLGPDGKIDPSLLPPIPSGLLIEVNGTPTPVQNIANFIAGPNITITADAFGGITISGSGTVSTAFSNITSGTNTTADMIVGSGAMLTFTGTGVVNANQLVGVSITNTPTGANETLVSTSSTTAQWQPAPSGTGNFLQVEVDFGFSAGNEGDIARTTVTGQTWVTAGSIILCNPFAGMTPDHSPDDTIVEGLVAYAENIVPGVGFDVVSYAPQNSWGRYLINVTGQ
jgi:hypothetical protein